eukprot:262686-Chlamydomonas_euryale.AAC.7
MNDNTKRRRGGCTAGGGSCVRQRYRLRWGGVDEPLAEACALSTSAGARALRLRRGAAGGGWLAVDRAPESDRNQADSLDGGAIAGQCACMPVQARDPPHRGLDDRDREVQVLSVSPLSLGLKPIF